MYVCVCKAVTDRDIQQAAENGCRSVRELGQEFGLGQQCGRCARMARDILKEHQQSVSAFDMALAQPA
ncbi:MAG: bacterioferritin-associated ferredoxin [Saccharospirillum sp.]